MRVEVETLSSRTLLPEPSWASPPANAASASPSPVEVQRHASDAVESIKRLLSSSPTRNAAIRYGVLQPGAGDHDAATTPSTASELGGAPRQQLEAPQRQQQCGFQHGDPALQQEQVQWEYEPRTQQETQRAADLRQWELQKQEEMRRQSQHPPQSAVNAGYLRGATGGCSGAVNGNVDAEGASEVTLRRGGPGECREFGFMVVPERDRAMLVVTWIDGDGLLARWNSANP
eukprot:CAMPEP_0176291980 /NCGR_PEP_ID=MMETSP0121_2-20121125/55839_1 /TAXON_ID=160619 /ORGANISM="Kryptoperidinium foliaceum, Strain CCMP 1326" /LENGTH=230 /DNA_ID=CAMNT_0017632861 /DNA_START=108 /DNA_END=797 /DNA_ORIENTATION=-